MAFRGRGRGRGYGGRGGGFGYAKQEPFQLFPEIELPKRENIPEEKALVYFNSRLQNYWTSSPYYLEESVSKKKESIDIEKFSDWGKPKSKMRRDSLFQFLQLGCHNFPKELVADSKREQRNPKKVRWNPDADLQKLDIFEKLELKYQSQEEKDGKEKKQGEDEDEDEDEGAQEADEEFSDDGDYNQNVDFDDDEDDFNMEDDNDDEAVY